MATGSKRIRPLALIVDDDLMHIQILTSVLGKFGIETDCAVTAQAFLDKVTQLKPDLCLVDINIDTVGDGFYAIESTRKILGKGQKIIAVSAASDRMTIENAVALGADDFIVKPLDRHVIASKLSRYVNIEQLGGNQRALLPIPESGSPATVYVELEVCAVEESGVILTSTHLLSKGISIHLDGDLIREVTGLDRPVLVTIADTWIEKDGVSYGASAIFDGTDVEVMTGIRKWLQASSHSKNTG